VKSQLFSIKINHQMW